MVIIYSTSWCPSCISAKRLLDSKEIKYEEINIEEVDISREELIKIAGAATVPQIMINETPIGGFDNLLELEQNGELNKMLKI
jgi:GrxC family glutaredoxin|tara:strand:+ start:556 stop:804 length:249 start_codon:yes stop_codon:yes gene_type:complete